MRARRTQYTSRETTYRGRRGHGIQSLVGGQYNQRDLCRGELDLARGRDVTRLSVD